MSWSRKSRPRIIPPTSRISSGLFKYYNRKLCTGESSIEVDTTEAILKTIAPPYKIFTLRLAPPSRVLFTRCTLYDLYLYAEFSFSFWLYPSLLLSSSLFNCGAYSFPQLLRVSRVALRRRTHIHTRPYTPGTSRPTREEKSLKRKVARRAACGARVT